MPTSVRKARNLNLEEDKPCPGPSTMVLFCQLEDCPPETQWGPWGPWGECSKNCGGGKRKRKRKCNTVKRYGQPSTCPGKCKSNFVVWKFPMAKILREFVFKLIVKILKPLPVLKLLKQQ